MEIRVDPADALIDEPAVVHILGASPNVTVNVRIAARDAAGLGWSQEIQLVADASGRCDTGQLIDPSRVWWDLQPEKGDKAPMAFAASATELEFTVSSGSASVTTKRRWLHSAAAAASIPGDGFVLHPYLPAGASGSSPGVVLIPGSTGPEAVAPLAALLASHGYVTAVLSYIYEEGLPGNLASVPLEVLARGIRSFAALPEVASDRVGLAAWSVGTGGALSALAGFPDLPVVAAAMFAPTCAIWQGLPDGPGQPPKVPSWTLAGADLPWLRIHGEKLIPELIKNELLDRFPGHERPQALHMRKSYDAGLKGLKLMAPEMIPVEKIASPLLICSGDSDALWPSAPMSRLLQQRRGSRPDDQFEFYSGGHMFRAPVTPTTVPWNDAFYFGGTAVENADQYRDAWAAQLAFWQKHLGS